MEGLRRYRSGDKLPRKFDKEAFDRHMSKVAEDRKRQEESDKQNRQAQKSTYKIKDAGNDLIIEKGSTLDRVAKSGEKISERARYMSADRQDKEDYKEMSNMLWSNPGEDKSSYEYTASKDMRVAKGEDVFNHIIDKYGDKTTSECWEYVKNGYGNDASVTEIKQKLYAFTEDVMKAHMSDIVDTYSKKGYDAIIDPEDYKKIGGVSNMPLIVLNPKNSVKLKKETSYK